MDERSLRHRCNLEMGLQYCEFAVNVMGILGNSEAATSPKTYKDNRLPCYI